MRHTQIGGYQTNPEGAEQILVGRKTTKEWEMDNLCPLL